MTFRKAQVVLDFLLGKASATPQDEVDAEVAVICGNHEIRTLTKFAEFVNRRAPEWIIATGGYGRGTGFMRQRLKESAVYELPAGYERMAEAELIADYLRQTTGRVDILVDSLSRNTTENLEHTKRIIDQRLKRVPKKVAIWQTAPQRYRALLSATEVFGSSWRPFVVCPDSDEQLSDLRLCEQTVEVFRLVGWESSEMGIHEHGELWVLNELHQHVRNEVEGIRDLFDQVRSEFAEYLNDNRDQQRFLEPYHEGM